MRLCLSLLPGTGALYSAEITAVWDFSVLHKKLYFELENMLKVWDSFL